MTLTNVHHFEIILCPCFSEYNGRRGRDDGTDRFRRTQTHCIFRRHKGQKEQKEAKAGYYLSVGIRECFQPDYKF